MEIKTRRSNSEAIIRGLGGGGVEDVGIRGNRGGGDTERRGEHIQVVVESRDTQRQDKDLSTRHSGSPHDEKGIHTYI